MMKGRSESSLRSSACTSQWMTAVCCALPFLLAGCQTKKETAAPVTNNAAAIVLLQAVNKGAQTCWVKSKDKEFRPYKVIPELDTRVGKPRILILNARSAQGLPQYVIEAEGTPARLTAYGPLASEPLAARINEDIMRWRNGQTSCTA